MLGVGEHAVYSVVLNLFPFISYYVVAFTMDCVSVSLSLSLHSLFLPPFFSTTISLLLWGGMATAGQTSRQGYA